MKLKKKFLFFEYYKEISIYDAYNVIINMNYCVCPRKISIDEIKKIITDIPEPKLAEIKLYVESLEEEIREFAYNECITFNYKDLHKKIKNKYPWLSNKSITRLISQGTYAAK